MLAFKHREYVRHKLNRSAQKYDRKTIRTRTKTQAGSCIGLRLEQLFQIEKVQYMMPEVELCPFKMGRGSCT